MFPSKVPKVRTGFRIAWVTQGDSEVRLGVPSPRWRTEGTTSCPWPHRLLTLLFPTLFPASHHPPSGCRSLDV